MGSGRGRRRIRESVRRERESSGYLFLQLLLCQVTSGNDDVPPLCATPVGLSCSDSSVSDQTVPFSRTRTKQLLLLLVQACCTDLGPLHPAQTFSYTLKFVSDSAWSLADTVARVDDSPIACLRCCWTKYFT